MPNTRRSIAIYGIFYVYIMQAHALFALPHSIAKKILKDFGDTVSPMFKIHTTKFGLSWVPHLDLCKKIISPAACFKHWTFHLQWCHPEVGHSYIVLFIK